MSGLPVQRIRVFVAADLEQVRQALRCVLQTAEDMEIAGEAATVEEFVRLTRDTPADVMLIDQDLLGGDGAAAIRKVKQSYPRTQIIVMADELDAVKALAAIDAGAAGYILKDIPDANLKTVIRSVCTGADVLHPAITRTLTDRFSRVFRARRGDRATMSRLTARELDILTEVAQGRSDDEIAKQFVVAPGTIKTHIRHILRKLAARNRAEAVAHVLRKGLLK